MKRHGKATNAYYQLKGANLKRLHALCKVPSIWHSGKGKAMARDMKSEVAGGRGQGWGNRWLNR